MSVPAPVSIHRWDIPSRLLSVENNRMSRLDHTLVDEVRVTVDPEYGYMLALEGVDADADGTPRRQRRQETYVERWHPHGYSHPLLNLPEWAVAYLDWARALHAPRAVSIGEPFQPGDTVRHLRTGEVGTVVRHLGQRTTVQIPGRWRASVFGADNLVHHTSKDTDAAPH